MALVDVKKHAWDEGELPEAEVQEVTVVAAEEHCSGDDGTLALEVNWMVGEDEGLDHVCRLARFKSSGDHLR